MSRKLFYVETFKVIRQSDESEYTTKISGKVYNSRESIRTALKEAQNFFRQDNTDGLTVVSLGLADGLSFEGKEKLITQ